MNICSFKRFCFLFILIFLIQIISTAQKNNASKIIEENALPFYINEYAKDFSDLQKVYIFPLSDEYFKRISDFQQDWLKKLHQIKFENLSVSDQVDYTLLKRNILEDVYALEQNKKNYSTIAYAIPFAEDIIKIQKARRRGNTPDAAALAATVSAITQSIPEIKNTVFEKKLATKVQQQTLVKAINDLRKGLKNVHDFYNGYNPLYSWWMKSTYPKADAALENYSSWVAKSALVLTPDKPMDNTGIIGNPIGRNEIIRQLQYQMIPYTPEELISIAEKEYAWCEAEMIKVSKQMGFGTEWKKALEKVKANHLKPGEQPAMINRLQEEAIYFIDSLHLVTIPTLARELWRMDMLSVGQMEFASYFLGGPQILIAYAHDDQDHETKEMIMRSGNYGFAHAEVFHELIPGHNLQHYMFSRYKPYRQVFNAPFSMEGWPLYWEMKLWNKGFDKTVDEKAGALFWRMTRCARIVFSLNYHLGNWTPQQCINLLIEKAGLEKFSAEAEVRRSFTGGYGPLYQLAYMIGALQLNGLYEEAVTSGKMSEKDFNDAYLREGPIPIEMLRAIILNKKIDKNFSTRWRFIKN